MVGNLKKVLVGVAALGLFSTAASPVLAQDTSHPGRLIALHRFSNNHRNPHHFGGHGGHFGGLFNHGGRHGSTNRSHLGDLIILHHLFR